MSDWYCPACSRYVAPDCVTFDERHEWCGAQLASGPVDDQTDGLLNHMADLLRVAWEDTEAAHGREGQTFYGWLGYLERALKIEGGA